MKVLKQEENFIATYDREEYELAEKEEFENNKKELENDKKELENNKKELENNQKELEKEKIKFAKELKKFGIPIEEIIKRVNLSSKQIKML